MRHYLDTTHTAVLHPTLSRLRGQVGQGRRNPNRRSRKWGGEDIFQTQRIATPPSAILRVRRTADFLQANPLLGRFFVLLVVVHFGKLRVHDVVLLGSAPSSLRNSRTGGGARLPIPGLAQV